MVRAVRHAAAEHDQRRVEEVHDAREHRPDAPARALEHRDRDRVAGRRRPRDVLGRHPPALVERRPEPRATAPRAPRPRRARPSAAAAGQRLEAADVAAAADDRRIVGDLDVADVAGAALGAAVEPAAGDDPGPDARPDLHDDDVVVAGRDAGSPLPEGEDVDVVVDPDGRAVAGGEPLPDRVAVPARHDRRRDRPAGRELDRARDADPDPPQPARHARGSSPAAGRTAPRPGRGTASGPGLDRRPARRGGRGSGRRASSSRRRCSSRPGRRRGGGRPTARNDSWRGGRPPVLGPRSPSMTSPRSSSSPTRWATIARPSPVRSTSSERDRDRPSRISSRTTTRASSASSGRVREGPVACHRRDDTPFHRSSGRLLHLTGQSRMVPSSPAVGRHRSRAGVPGARRSLNARLAVADRRVPGAG